MDKEELPVVLSIGWVRMGKDWVVLELHTQGTKVVEREALFRGNKSGAMNALRMAIVKKLLVPG